MRDDPHSNDANIAEQKSSSDAEPSQPLESQETYPNRSAELLKGNQGDFQKRIDAVLKLLQDHVGQADIFTTGPEDGKKRKENPNLAARLVNTLPYLERLKNSRVNIGQAELAAAALVAEKAQKDLARGIIEDLERRVRIYKSTFRSIFHGRSQVAQLLVGICAHVLLFVAAVLMLMTFDVINFKSSAFWVALGGASGGITSLLIRLHDFAILDRWSQDSDPKVVFFTGLLKPVVSTAFALFVWTAFNSKFFNIAATISHEEQYYFTLSFIAGFSERFAPDLANRAPPMKP